MELEKQYQEENMNSIPEQKEKQNNELPERI